MQIWKLGERALERVRRSPDVRRLLHPDPTGAVLVSGATRDALGLVGPGDAELVVPGDAAWAAVPPRLVEAWAARIADPLPPEVRDEAYLLLYTRPTMTIEYMGRGRVANEVYLPAAKTELFSLDRAGGRRTYLFRRMTAALDARLKGMNERFHGYRDWLSDPGAKLVLSIGGGGFRMFAATSVLRALDHLLGDRSRVAEVWGSSGGAFLGYVYSSGFRASVIDDLGYDLYHGRHRHLTDGSLTSLVRASVRTLGRKALRRHTDPEMAAWLEVLDRKEPVRDRAHPRLPFFPVAANPTRGGMLSALAAPEDIPPECADFILPCSPRDAVAASTAVPVALAAQRNITGSLSPGTDTWIDGSITDENPLVLPYIKWLRQRQRDPDGTPPTLKIILVNLNLRSSESGAVRLIQGLPLVRAIDLVHQLPRVVDMLLDSKTNASIMALTETGNVEIMSLKLVLGTLSINNPRDIPVSIRTGRSLEAWQISTYRRGL